MDGILILSKQMGARLHCYGVYICINPTKLFLPLWACRRKDLIELDNKKERCTFILSLSHSVWPRKIFRVRYYVNKNTFINLNDKSVSGKILYRCNPMVDVLN